MRPVNQEDSIRTRDDMRIDARNNDTKPTGGARISFRVAAGLALVGLFWLMVAACAVVEPPPGGPVDSIRPHMVSMVPDSASVDLNVVEVVELTFSEKMDRVSAAGWLHFFPEQTIRQTKWHSATRAEIVLEVPMPRDTVIVVEVAGGMRDAHKVANRHSRRYPISTGGIIPTGRISGVLVMADSAVTTGVVELYNVPPDTLEFFEQDILRRTVTDKTGAYTFDWLPVPGGPWLLRAFADANGDLRPGDNEAQRLLPDTLSLAIHVEETVAGVTTLYPRSTPGRMLIAPFTRPGFAGPVMAWTMSITEDDTGWVPVSLDRANFGALDDTLESPLGEVAAGNNRLVVFMDVDGDSLFSGVPDSLLGTVPDSLRYVGEDSVTTHFLEPWLLVEDILVEPGLDTPVTLPLAAYTITPWMAPPPEPEVLDNPALSDSLSAVIADSLDSSGSESADNEQDQE